MFEYSYLKFFLLQLIFSYLIFFNKCKKKQVYISIFIIAFSIYLGGRKFEIGTDTLNYVNEYLKGNGGYFQEKGFKYLNYILYKMGFSPSQYLIIISLFNTFLYYKGYSLCIENSKRWNEIMFVYLFSITSLFGHVNILRQSLAGGFLILSYAYLKKKKYFKQWLFFILACFFHKTALLFILFQTYKIRKKISKLKRIEKVIILLIVIIISMFIPKVLMAHKKFYIYFYEETNFSFYIKFIILLLYYFILNSKLNRLLGEEVIYYGLLLVALFLRFELLASRLIYYIFPFVMLNFVEVINQEKYKQKLKPLLLNLVFIYKILILFYPSFKIMFKL